MHFKKLYFLLVIFIGFIITQGSQCTNEPKEEPGVNSINITVLDENNTPVPNAPIGLFKIPIEIQTRRADCLVDTFSTKADGTVSYSFLNKDKNYFAVQVLPKRLMASNKFIFDDIGAHSTTLQTIHAQPLININVHASTFDSTSISINPDLSNGIICNNPISLSYSLNNRLDEQKITDNTIDHQFVLLGIPNKTNLIRRRHYKNGGVLDSIFSVQLGSTSVNIDIN